MSIKVYIVEGLNDTGFCNGDQKRKYTCQSNSLLVTCAFDVVSFDWSTFNF